MVAWKSSLTWARPAERNSFQLRNDNLVHVANRRLEPWEVFEEQPGLFRTFAELDGKPEGYLGFADRFGLLKWRGDNGIGSEPLELWRETHATITAKVIHLDYFENLCPDIEPGPIALHDEPDSPFQTACSFVAQSERLGDLLGINLLDGTLFQVVMLGTKKGVIPALKATPKDLRSALLAQVASSLLQGTRYIKCGGCEKWFPKHPRETKMVCSPACRKRVFRRRRKQGESGT